MRNIDIGKKRERVEEKYFSQEMLRNKIIIERDYDNSEEICQSI